MSDENKMIKEVRCDILDLLIDENWNVGAEMAFDFFMNMEKLSLTIAEKHVLYMTNDNYMDSCFLDTEKLVNNLENGFVVITQLSCFLKVF